MSPYDSRTRWSRSTDRTTPHKALDCALSIAEHARRKLTVLAIEGKLPAYAASLGEVDEVKREKDEFFSRVLADAARQAASAASSSTPNCCPGHSAEVIPHYATAHGHDLIVIAHHEHFLGDFLLGSTADRVAHHAHCPVMVVR